MVAPNRVKVGDVLYDVHREPNGHSAGSRLGSWPVKILEVKVDGIGLRFLASWNGNTPRWLQESHVRRLRRTPAKRAT